MVYQSGKIKVLIIEDSQLMIELLQDVFSNDSEIEVVGTEKNGEEGIKKTIELSPNIITMDLQMPKLVGFEAIKQIMSQKPTPVIVISSQGASDKNIFTALSYGVLDVMDKNCISKYGIKGFIEKVKTLAEVNVVRHPLGNLENYFNKTGKINTVFETNVTKLVAIAASTGGPQTIIKILKNVTESMKNLSVRLNEDKLIIKPKSEENELQSLYKLKEKLKSVHISGIEDIEQVLPVKENNEFMIINWNATGHEIFLNQFRCASL